MQTTESTETTDARRAILVSVADSFGATTLDPYGCGDPAEDWSQVTPMPRWVAVTVRFDRCESEACGAAGTVWFTGHDERADAERAAGRHVVDDVAPEAPLAVVDLDSGNVYRVARDFPVRFLFTLAGKA